uniref:Translocon-associated protein subunit alpha n=1 Tax=Ixodes scapularis TaxID=6945 RepID=A0A4D5RCL2_IXOSC
MFSRYMLLVLLIVPLATLFQQNGAFAQADDDDEDVVVEDSAQADQKDAAVTEPEDDGSQPLKPSPDGDTFLLFTKPQGFQSKLPAGKEVHFLVGFTNKGSKDFVLDTMDASFRYPMDFSFYIQNFTTIGYNKVVKPKQQATLSYSFFASQSFSARPFGTHGQPDVPRRRRGPPTWTAVFHETVEVVEVDEGLERRDVLPVHVSWRRALGAAGWWLASSSWDLVSKKRAAPKQNVEMGTQNWYDVDYDWVP